jgi:hypothetical protein
MRKFILLISIAFTTSVFGQNLKNNPTSNHGNKFEQLGTILPDANTYRTASGAPGHQYWQQKADYEIDAEFNWLIYRYSISKRIVEVLVNDIVVIEYKLEDDEELTSGVEPHIVFGAGNFPKNGFNLNYCSYDIDYLMISKSYKQLLEIIKIKNERSLDNTIVGLYDFEKHTEYKVYDLSENSNFIHKII